MAVPLAASYQLTRIAPWRSMIFLFFGLSSTVAPIGTNCDPHLFLLYAFEPDQRLLRQP
jgi:hypothetical protein